MTFDVPFIARAFNWTTANWITIVGGLLAVISMTLFALGFDQTALCTLIASCLTDWFDGAVGRYQQGKRPHMTREEEDKLSVWQRINYRGVTHFGRALDPLVDKIRFIGLLWVVGISIVPTVLMVALTTVALILTLMRPVKRYLELDAGGSNNFGKFKVYAELIAIATLILATRPIFSEINTSMEQTWVQWALWISLGTALVLALVSLLGHISSGVRFYQKQSRQRNAS